MGFYLQQAQDRYGLCRFKHCMRALLLCLLLVPAVTKPQIITTFCGNGIHAVSTDGSPATATSMYGAGGGTFDDAGNYYFSQGISNPRIYKINTVGIINTVAGSGTSGFSGDNGPATLAQLKAPNPPAVDKFGNIFIPDGNNNRIRKVDVSTGIITTIAGTGMPGFSGDGGPATSAMLSVPSSIIFDKYGTLYFADAGNGRVRKIDGSGNIFTIAGTVGSGDSGDNGPATSAHINGVLSIAFDNSDNLILAINGANRIRKINTAGVITTIAGNGSYIYNGDGIPATNAQFDPWWIAIDKYDNIFVPDHYNNRVRRIDKFGLIHDFAGTGVAGYNGDNILANMAQLNWPETVAIDSCGNVYVADNLNARIRKISFPHCNYLAVETLRPQILSTPYPNPTFSTLHIDGIENPCTYHVLNIIGYSAMQGMLNAGNNELSLRSLPPGIYLLEIINEEKQKTITKIIKQ